MKKIVFLILALMLLFSCDTASSTQPVEDTNNNPLISRSAKVLDKDGDFIGYAVEVSPSGLIIMSTTGYIYPCDWELKGWNRDVYATGLGGTGNLFYVDDEYNSAKYGKSVFRMGDSSILFSFKNINANGLAESTANLTSYQSYIDYDHDTFIDSTDTIYDYEIAYEVETVTFADIGLPELSTITFPLNLQFEDE